MRCSPTGTPMSAAQRDAPRAALHRTDEGWLAGTTIRRGYATGNATMLLRLGIHGRSAPARRRMMNFVDNDPMPSEGEGQGALRAPEARQVCRVVYARYASRHASAQAASSSQPI